MSGGTTISPRERSVSFGSSKELLGRAGRSRLEIDERTVHVWGWTLEGSTSCLKESRRWLDEQEREQSARFVREEDRRRYLLAHACLRAVLGRYLDRPPETVRFLRSPSGKPFVVSAGRPGRSLAFNMSHSQDRMLVGIARGHELGVDLEQVRPDTDVRGLAERYYAEEERAMLADLPPAEQRRAFFRYWVAKEAVLKGEGVGIPSLQACEVRPLRDQPRAIIAAKGDTVQPGWTVEWLFCGADWEAAVACHGDSWTVRCMPDA